MAAKKAKKPEPNLELPVPTKPLLIKLHRNWADEFDVEGFVVMDASAWEEHKALAKVEFEKKGSIERYFGTNESLDFGSLEDYLDSFAVLELTMEEYEVFKKFFLVKGYSWEYPKGKINCRFDKIDFGTIPMIEAGEDD